MDMGNLGFPNMAFNFPNHNTDSSSDSDSDVSSSYEENSDSSTGNENSDISSDEGVVTVDSTISVPKKKYHSCFKITPNDVRQIEMNLDFYEFISIIFLLFDIIYALQEIRSMIAAGPEKFSRDKLSTWAQASPDKWNYKFIEALAIIQNHQVLLKLGFCEEDINAMTAAPVYINRLKKVLFSSVCDLLKRDQAQILIDYVRNDAHFTKTCDADITLQCDPIYIEFHLLFWASQNYIDFESEPYLKNLTKHLKLMNLPDVVDRINEETAAFISIPDPNSNHDEDDYYEIKDPNNCGLLVIINNANFKKNIEKRKQFQNKLPKEPLDDRVGSEADVQNLRRIFEDLNFKVVVRHDIFHDELDNEVYRTVRDYFEESRHSILILCVLSHGDEGVVFGANSIPIWNEEIINSVSGCSRLVGLLAGIPKVVIIQACQGKRKMYVDPEPKLLVPDGFEARLVADGNDLQLDGPENYDPKDIIVCMATIKGFVAVRSTTCGTIYIQELCHCVSKYHKEKHFYDIMTKVQKNLRSKRLSVKHYKNRPICMIPEITSTLEKSLFLTPEHTTIKNHTVS